MFQLTKLNTIVKLTKLLAVKQEVLFNFCKTGFKIVKSHSYNSLIMIRFYKLFLITLFTLYFSCSQSVALTYKEIHPNHTSFDYEGRFLKTNVSEYAFEWPGTCIKTSFTGHYLAIKLGHEAYNQNPQENTAFFNVFIDDSLVSVLQVSGKLRYFEIKLPFKNKLHELKIYKRTEAIIGTSYFGGIKVEAKSKVLKLKKQATYKFQFIGNSITCGYGVLGLSLIHI